MCLGPGLHPLFLLRGQRAQPAPQVFVGTLYRALPPFFEVEFGVILGVFRALFGHLLEQAGDLRIVHHREHLDRCGQRLQEQAPAVGIDTAQIILQLLTRQRRRSGVRNFVQIVDIKRELRPAMPVPQRLEATFEK